MKIILMALSCKWQIWVFRALFKKQMTWKKSFLPILSRLLALWIVLPTLRINLLCPVSPLDTFRSWLWSPQGFQTQWSWQWWLTVVPKVTCNNAISDEYCELDRIQNHLEVAPVGMPVRIIYPDHFNWDGKTLGSIIHGLGSCTE